MNHRLNHINASIVDNSTQNHPYAGSKKMYLTTNRLILAGVLLSTSWTISAVEDFSVDTLSFSYNTQAEQDTVNGRGTSDEDKVVFQYEHFGTNEWGFLYADIEYIQGEGVGAIPQLGDGGDAHDYFGAIIPAVSLSKVTGKSFTMGVISDVSLIGFYRASDYANYRSWGFGVSANFEVPGFQWFETSLLTHDSDWYVEPDTFDTNTGKNYSLDKGEWMWRTYLIAKPLLIEDERFRFNAFITVNGTQNHGTAVFGRFDATWEILGHSDFQVGLRYEYVSHENDLSLGFGDNKYDSHTPMFIFKYVL